MVQVGMNAIVLRTDLPGMVLPYLNAVHMYMYMTQWTKLKGRSELTIWCTT